MYNTFMYSNNCITLCKLYYDHQCYVTDYFDSPHCSAAGELLRKC